MQTRLNSDYINTPMGQRAEEILRSCVHCGFCNATCPTYQLLGDELDGPRGRIYQIKQILEGAQSGKKTKLHLDRCLNCLNCETTCPSGVRYHELLEIGQRHISSKVKLPIKQRILRKLLLTVMPYRNRFKWIISTGQFFRPLMPASLACLVPPKPSQPASTGKTVEPAGNNTRMLFLQGCVHNAINPDIHTKTHQILSQLDIELITISKAGCCGAMSHHMQAEQQTNEFIRNNIDSWWPEIEKGVEALVSNASGCGVMLKDYGRLMANVPEYSEKAAKISELAKDISEIIQTLDISSLKLRDEYKKIAYHPPCSLQHGQKLPGIVEQILLARGIELLAVNDKHLCCGSAGTYSIFQPAIADTLRDNKLANLQRQQPDVIATANIGCLHHLQTKSEVPVIHWIELFE